MADKYISKHEAYKTLKDLEAAYIYPPVKEAYATAARRIDEIKAADVQPIKTSKWCPPLMGQGKCDTYCERCHGKIMRNSTGIFEETPFCPHCGADMRGEQND